MNEMLYVVRHAHRDTTYRHLDNGLSFKGQHQAKLIDLYLRRMTKMKAPLFLSSPKIRCQETLEPAATFFNQKLEIREELNENTSNESSMEFANRILDFFDWWKSESPPICVLCSHGDWIPIFLGLCLGKSMDLQKGGVACLQWENHHFKLIEIHQNLAKI